MSKAIQLIVTVVLLWQMATAAVDAVVYEVEKATLAGAAYSERLSR